MSIKWTRTCSFRIITERQFRMRQMDGRAGGSLVFARTGRGPERSTSVSLQSPPENLIGLNIPLADPPKYTSWFSSTPDANRYLDSAQTGHNQIKGEKTMLTY